MTYVNQNKRATTATATAASAMMTTITPPAMAPALLLPLGAGVGGFPIRKDSTEQSLKKSEGTRRALRLLTNCNFKR